MTAILAIHPDNPQPRLIKQAVEVLKQGGVLVYPTDAAYALCCQIGEKQAVDRIRQIRGIDDKQHLTLVCRDLSELATYAKVSNTTYRLLKNNTPGPFTFVLPAGKEVPKRLMHPKKKTIGLKIAQHTITQALCDALQAPFLTSSLILPEQSQALNEAWDIKEQIGHQVDAIIDAGYCANEESTVVSLLDDIPEILRYGRGDASEFV